MTKKHKISVISIALIMALLFSMFSQYAFAMVYKGENYTFSDNCVISFSAKDGINQSDLKMSSATVDAIKKGLTFGNVFPDSIENSDSHAIFKSLGLISPAGSKFYPVEKTTLINTYLDTAYVNVTASDPETKEITAAVIYPSVSWVYEYSISYELNGGVNSPNNPDKYVYSTGVSGFSDPVKENAVFAGWYSDSSFSSPVREISSSDFGDKTLYAKWEDIQYLLNFNTAPGEVVSSVNVPLKGKILDYLSLTSYLPVKEGYTFLGWVKEDGSALTSKDIMTENGFNVYTSWIKSSAIKGSFGEAVPENHMIFENEAGEYSVTLAENEVLPLGLSLGEDGVVTGNFEEAGNFEVNINITDKTTGTVTKAKMFFEIVGLQPVIDTLPTASTLKVGSKLKWANIRGGVFLGQNNEPIEGTCKWKDGSVIFSKQGNYEEPAIFVPNDKSYVPLEFTIKIFAKKSSSSSSSSDSDIYLITSSCSSGGNISPKGTTSVFEYEDIAYTFRPLSGYKVSEITIDGEDYEPSEIGNVYTFQDVRRNHEIYVRFEKTGSSSSSSKHNSSSSKKDNDKDDDDDDDSKQTNKKPSSENYESKAETLPDVGSVFNVKNKTAYIQGYTDGSFKPSNSLTRAEAAVILSKVLLVQPENKTYTSNFSDVSSSDWFNNYVCFLTEQGIINGYNDGTFKPNAKITRAELVSLVAKALNVTGHYQNPFTDTNGMWAENSISALSSFGWIKGYTDGSFKPNANITRAETTVFLNAVLGRSVSVSSMAQSGKTFTDVSPDDWFYGNVIEAANLS